jgi:hypothetical protein
MRRLFLKHLALAALLACGLIACPAAIEPEPVSSAPASGIPVTPNPDPSSPNAPDLNIDGISVSPTLRASSAGLAVQLKPAENQTTKLDGSSIDLNPSRGGQQLSFKDPKGTFSLERGSGTVTFTPQPGQTGEAQAKYTIKTAKGRVLKPATITIEITAVPAPGGPIKVLFIGNSRTRYFNIPQQVQQLASNESRKLEVRMVAFDGWTLEGHWNSPNSAALQAIREGGWDDVVLQELSSRPVLENAKFVASVKNFNAEIKKIGARTVLYENWWRKDLTYPQVQLSAAYKSLADDIGAAISPVGSAWLESSSTNPSSVLFNPDGNHATALGAYLTACEFYAFFYEKTPKGLPNLGVTGNTLGAQDAAWKTFTKLETQYHGVPGTPVPTL